MSNYARMLAWMPQWGVRTAVHMPDPRILVDGAYSAKPFNFTALQANLTYRESLTLDYTIQMWGIAASPTGGNFEIKISSGIEGHFREFYSNWVNQENGAGAMQGTGTILLLKRPEVILAGELLIVAVRNLTNVTIDNVQVCLHGTEPSEPIAIPPQFQGVA